MYVDILVFLSSTRPHKGYNRNLTFIIGVVHVYSSFARGWIDITATKAKQNKQKWGTLHEKRTCY